VRKCTRVRARARVNGTELKLFFVKVILMKYSQNCFKTFKDSQVYTLRENEIVVATIFLTTL